MENKELNIDTLDLQNLLEGVQSNILTPKLNEISTVSNTKKPKVIADKIIKELHSRIDTNITKDILHDGVIHKIRYFDIEPLLRGSWSQISLMLLLLSYNEQCTMIESIYPKELQLTAKAFAINCTPNNDAKTVYIENDKELVEKIDGANLGIATIIVMLKSLGCDASHLDNIKRQMDNMKKLRTDISDIRKFTNATKRNDDKNRYRDSLR